MFQEEDGDPIRMLYFKNDIKETNIDDGTMKYYYVAHDTWQTTTTTIRCRIECPMTNDLQYQLAVKRMHIPPS